MDPIGNIAVNPLPAEGAHAAAPPPMINIRQVANRQDYDLSSFFIDKNTPIDFEHFDFNDMSHQKMSDEAWKAASEAMRLHFKEKYEGKPYPDESVGKYIYSHKYPSARGKDYYPLKFDANGDNIMTHGTKLAVVLYFLANCNLQIVPAIKQLKLLGKIHSDIKLTNAENFYQLCSQVLVSRLNLKNCSFFDVKELARLAAQSGESFFDKIPIVVIGDGSEPGSLFAATEAKSTCKRLNIRILACPDEDAKKITLDCLQKIFDITKNDRIKNIRVCTWDALERKNDRDTPDIGYIQASGDTIETHARPALNLSHIKNNLQGLLSLFYIDKSMPIPFEQFDFNDTGHRTLSETFMREDLEEIRQELVRNYANDRFPYKTIREYLAYTPEPDPESINFRPDTFDPYADNNVTHGTNLDVVSHAIINCGLQLMPGIEQLLRLGKQHEINYKADPKLMYLLSMAVRATSLRALHSLLRDAEEFSLAAAQETTNILSSIPVIVIGEGVNERDMYAGLSNEFAYARVNIWFLVLRDDAEKRIVMEWFNKVRDALDIKEINSLMFCTLQDVSDCRRKTGRATRPDLEALMAKCHTLA
ncbi:hypothetical protein SC171_17840 [Pantoea cypripedii]|uniref:hypothetical protein n=1 Tax=Pantoea cypripedii TaxID=55209 RepID=UPI002FCA5102